MEALPAHDMQQIHRALNTQPGLQMLQKAIHGQPLVQCAGQCCLLSEWPVLSVPTFQQGMHLPEVGAVQPGCFVA